MKLQWISACLYVAALVTAPACMPQGQTTPKEESSGKPAHILVVPHQSRPSGQVPNSSSGKSVSAQKQTMQFLDMPLDFEANRGQAPSKYAFVAHGPSYALGISSSELTLSLHRPADKPRQSLTAAIDAPEAVESSILRLNIVGSSGGSLVSGLDPQPGQSNYFVGNDPAKWRTAVPHFNRVKIAGAYPGIDVMLYGDRKQLEYDFDVSAGADPRRIRLRAEDAQALTLDGKGNAILSTAAGNVELKHPVSYQDVDGVRRPVDSAFEIEGGNELKIRLGHYDRSRALVIDPVLIYGVAFGGSNGNEALGLALDAAGNTYVTGNTCSADFPSTAGTFQNMTSNPAALACQDAFVTKIDPTGSTLIYSDYIGGSGGGGTTTGAHIALDGSGNVYVAGATRAVDFPTVSNIGPTAPGPCAILGKTYNCPDGFVFKLSPDGSQLLFSTLLGGSQTSGATQVKLNSLTGDLDVVGVTDSSNFLPAPNTLQTAFNGGTCANSVPCFNGFLVGLDPATGKLRYSTFLGGAGSAWALGLAIDGGGNLYVGGMAQLPLSSSMGTVTHTYGPSGGATATGNSLFVAKLNLSANKLTPGYLTVIEGDKDTGGSGIALDSTGNLYFAGSTAALQLGVTTGVFQTTNKNSGATYGNNCLWGPVLSPFLPSVCGTGIVGKLDSTGALSFLSYLGGSGQDIGAAVAPDTLGNIWVTGDTSSTDFPVTTNHYAGQSGFDTPFLAEVSNDGSKLEFATQIAGTFGGATDLVIDGSNNIYISGFGSTAQSTPGSYPADPQVYIDAFVQKWGEGVAPSITVSPLNLNFPATALGASSAPMTITVQNTSTVAVELGVKLQATYIGMTPSDFPESTTCSASLAAGASCTITVTFAPGPPSPACLALQGCNPASRTANIQILSNAMQGTQLLGLSGAAVVGPSFSFSPNPIVFPAQAAGTTSAQLFAQGESLGDSVLAVSNIALSGPNASDFSLQLTGVGGPDCVTNPVPPGSLCNLGITFSPPANATGTRTATLTFTDTAGDSPQSIPVSGTVASANFLNISPLNLSPNFPVAFGTSTYAVLDLQNPSTTGSVQVTGLNITGANMGDFSAAPSNCGTSGALPMTIPANSTCYVDVTFNPAAGASGMRAATLTVQTTPAAAGLPTVSLTGDAVTNSQPAMSFSFVPNPLNFGGLQVGETSNNASVLFTISNKYPIPCAGGASTCGAPLIISSITPGLSDYTVISQASGCAPFPATIAIGSGCTYALVFKPAQAGPRNTNIVIQSNDPQGTVQLPLYGSGFSLPLGEILGSALDFGRSAIGVASPPLTTTLKNAGQANLVISGVSVTSNYAIGGNTCTGSIPPQGTCTVSITFTPPSADYFTGTLKISDNDPIGSQQIVTLTGTGATGPQLRFTPAALDFGNEPANSTSAPQTITCTSTGDTALNFAPSGFRTSADYILQASTCGSSLPPGASCTIGVQFKPSIGVAGGFPYPGTLLVTDNAQGSPQPVYVHGMGVPATTAASTTVLVSSLNPSTFGQSVMFTATVTGPAGNTTIPTGSVNFFDGATTLGSGTLNSAGSATLSNSTLSVGSHSITAIYGGDTNFTGSTSTALTQVVSSGTITSITTLNSSLNPSASGQSVTFTATVSGPSGNTTPPTGTITFLDGTTTLGTGTLNTAWQATLTTSALALGTHSITASYGGNSTFAGSTSSVLTQVVNPKASTATTTMLASSVNPSASGQSVMFTATVTGPSGNTTIPTGSVNFLDGSTTLGSGTLNSAGAGTFSTSSLGVGSHSITAVYGGDTIFVGSTSIALTQVVNPPAQMTSTTTVSSSLNPSASGQSVTFTSTVTGQSGSTITPTGTVTFMDGASALGTGSLNASAQATYTTSSLTVGSHSITAVYGGDTNFTGSTSTALTQTVGTPSFTVSFNPTTVTVTAGTSGNTTVSVTPALGFNQQVSFSCSGLPAASTCTFSPATVTPNGTSVASTTLTVATDVATASLTQPAPFTGRTTRGSTGTLLSLVLLGLSGLVRFRRNWKGWMFGLTLIAALGMAMSGCGGSSNSNGGGGGGATTPKGTTTVTVTAVAGSLSQPATFTLTVQ